MALLAAASFWSWAVIFFKMKEFRRVSKNNEGFLKHFWSGASLTEIARSVKTQNQNPMGSIFLGVMSEWKKSSIGKGDFDVRSSQLHRLDRLIESGIRSEMTLLERYTGFLATIGSCATFVGLLGTVWGIMHSFQSIAAAKSTSLDIVAPAIAEALAATALGLIAAIPAMVAYNKFSQMLSNQATELEVFCDDFKNVLAKSLLEDK